MKKNIVILLFIVTICIQLGCKKLFTNPNTYTLKGTVFIDCSKTPIANAIVQYADYGTTGFGGNANGIIGIDTTDANGNFEIKYIMPEGKGVLIEPNLYVGGVNVLYGVPETKNLSDLNIYAAPISILNVKANVTKAYTNYDTLLVNNLITGVSNLKIAGPFASGIIYSNPQYRVLKHYFIDDNHPAYDSTKYVGYKLNNNSWQIKRFAPIPCKTIDVVLDIK